jgi:hypothetical protein
MYLYINIYNYGMAKRRDLKKSIDGISNELILEILVCSLQPNPDKIKLEALMDSVFVMNKEFRSRIQNPSGNSNKKIIKQYYSRLIEDFNVEIDKVISEIVTLNKEKIEN